MTTDTNPARREAPCPCGIDTTSICPWCDVEHPDVVVHNEDGTLSLTTPFAGEPWTGAPVEPLTFDQVRAVLHLAHMRAMETLARVQLPDAGIHLARAERERWKESSLAYARRSVEELEQRASAFAEAAAALEALLWGGEPR